MKHIMTGTREYRSSDQMPQEGQMKKVPVGVM